jgi:hypothetical protein
MDEIRQLQEERRKSSLGVGLGTKADGFDSNIYEDESQYISALPTEQEEREFEELENDVDSYHPSSRNRTKAPKDLIEGSVKSTDDTSSIMGYREQFGSGLVNTRISDRESEVRKAPV